MHVYWLLLFGSVFLKPDYVKSARLDNLQKALAQIWYPDPNLYAPSITCYKRCTPEYCFFDCGWYARNGTFIGYRPDGHDLASGSGTYSYGSHAGTSSSLQGGAKYDYRTSSNHDNNLSGNLASEDGSSRYGHQGSFTSHREHSGAGGNDKHGNMGGSSFQRHKNAFSGRGDMESSSYRGHSSYNHRGGKPHLYNTEEYHSRIRGSSKKHPKNGQIEINGWKEKGFGSRIPSSGNIDSHGSSRQRYSDKNSHTGGKYSGIQSSDKPYETQNFGTRENGSDARDLERLKQELQYNFDSSSSSKNAKKIMKRIERITFPNVPKSKISSEESREKSMDDLRSSSKKVMQVFQSVLNSEMPYGSKLRKLRQLAWLSRHPKKAGRLPSLSGADSKIQKDGSYSDNHHSKKTSRRPNPSGTDGKVQHNMYQDHYHSKKTNGQPSLSDKDTGKIQHDYGMYMGHNHPKNSDQRPSLSGKDGQVRQDYDGHMDRYHPKKTPGQPSRPDTNRGKTRQDNGMHMAHKRPKKAGKLQNRPDANKGKKYQKRTRTSQSIIKPSRPKQKPTKHIGKPSEKDYLKNKGKAYNKPARPSQPKIKPSRPKPMKPGGNHGKLKGERGRQKMKLNGDLPQIPPKRQVSEEKHEWHHPKKSSPSDTSHLRGPNQNTEKMKWLNNNKGNTYKKPELSQPRIKPWRPKQKPTHPGQKPDQLKTDRDRQKNGKWKKFKNSSQPRIKPSRPKQKPPKPDGVPSTLKMDHAHQQMKINDEGKKYKKPSQSKIIPSRPKKTPFNPVKKPGNPPSPKKNHDHKKIKITDDLLNIPPKRQSGATHSMGSEGKTDRHQLPGASPMHSESSHLSKYRPNHTKKMKWLSGLKNGKGNKKKKPKKPTKPKKKPKKSKKKPKKPSKPKRKPKKPKKKPKKPTKPNKKPKKPTKGGSTYNFNPSLNMEFNVLKKKRMNGTMPNNPHGEEYSPLRESYDSKYLNHQEPQHGIFGKKKGGGRTGKRKRQFPMQLASAVTKLFKGAPKIPKISGALKKAPKLSGSKVPKVPKTSGPKAPKLPKSKAPKGVKPKAPKPGKGNKGKGTKPGKGNKGKGSKPGKNHKGKGTKPSKGNKGKGTKPQRPNSKKPKPGFNEPEFPDVNVEVNHEDGSTVAPAKKRKKSMHGESSHRSKYSSKSKDIALTLPGYSPFGRKGKGSSHKQSHMHSSWKKGKRGGKASGKHSNPSDFPAPFEYLASGKKSQAGKGKSSSPSKSRNQGIVFDAPFEYFNGKDGGSKNKKSSMHNHSFHGLKTRGGFPKKTHGSFRGSLPKKSDRTPSSQRKTAFQKSSYKHHSSPESGKHNRPSGAHGAFSTHTSSRGRLGNGESRGPNEFTSGQYHYRYSSSDNADTDSAGLGNFNQAGDNFNDFRNTMEDLIDVNVRMKVLRRILKEYMRQQESGWKTSPLKIIADKHLVEKAFNS